LLYQHQHLLVAVDSGKEADAGVGEIAGVFGGEGVRG